MEMVMAERWTTENIGDGAISPSLPSYCVGCSWHIRFVSVYSHADFMSGCWCLFSYFWYQETHVPKQGLPISEYTWPTSQSNVLLQWRQSCKLPLSSFVTHLKLIEDTADVFIVVLIMTVKVLNGMSMSGLESFIKEQERLMCEGKGRDVATRGCEHPSSDKKTPGKTYGTGWDLRLSMCSNTL